MIAWRTYHNSNLAGRISSFAKETLVLLVVGKLRTVFVDLQADTGDLSFEQWKPLEETDQFCS